MPEIRFDDIDALKGLASEEFGPFGPELEVTQDMINRFADVTGDHQWIHIDVERSKRESPFGTTIAHGFLILSLLPVLADGSDLQISGFSSVINYGADKLRFIQPVPSDSKLQRRSRVVDAVPKSGGTLLTQESDVRVVGAEKPAMLYTQLTLFLP